MIDEKYELKEEDTSEQRKEKIEFQLRMLMLVAQVALPELNITIVVYGQGALAAASTGACNACVRDALSYVASMQGDAVHLSHDVEGETKH